MHRREKRKQRQHPPTISPNERSLLLRYKDNTSARCSFGVCFSAGEPLRIERATYSSSSRDVHKWWQVCVRGRLQMTHLSFYFKASFGHHPSMRDGATLTGLQSCLCASSYRQVVLSFEWLFYHLEYNIKVHAPCIQAVLVCFVFFSALSPTYLHACSRFLLSTKLLQIRSCNPFESLAASAMCLRWHPHPRPGQIY